MVGKGLGWGVVLLLHSRGASTRPDRLIRFVFSPHQLGSLNHRAHSFFSSRLDVRITSPGLFPVGR